MNETLIISTSDVDRIVREAGPDAVMDELIAHVGEAFATYNPSETRAPVRGGFSYDRPVTGLVEWMPCMRVGQEVVVKMVGYHPENPERFGLPTIVSTISTYDTSTGHLSCLMDATLLTAMRTGAASAVASSLMCRPDATELGLIGAGAQAITQVHALCRVLPIRRIRVYDIDDSALKTFAKRLDGLAADIEIEITDRDDVVRNSDVLCTATSVGVGKGPVIGHVEPRSWAHINAVGSDFPGKTELPVSILRRSLVVPDFEEQAVKEGECQQLKADEIGPSLAHFAGHPALAREHRDSLTVFDSTGWALEDAAAMEVFLAHALRMGLGRSVRLEATPDDPRDPYESVRAAIETHLTD
ncbi:MAG: ornithine cyclodeaminase family protein [Rhodothermales bacterium]|nr:ornithine cyclodeaminase family protein [Rhodothermales bacterium]